MSYNNGPRIITSGLSLCLDVSNPKSYPGSGTAWKDLANGIPFVSAGTTTPVEVVNGAISFAFNGSGYWYSTSGDSLVDMGGDCTLIMWMYSEDVTVRRTVFEKRGTSYASYQQEIAVTWETDEAFSYYSRYSADYDYAYMAALNNGLWNMTALKMSTGRTPSARTGYRSKNGSAWVSDYYSRSSTALVSAGAIVIGDGYAGTCDVGNIGMVLCYNRMISDSEILQIYNATKSKYKL